MRYEGSIYRPPSEARSYLLQVTLGCTHNRCTFCSMYRDKPFSIRPLDEVFEDIYMARKYYSYIDRVFLCDGDALCLPTDNLVAIMQKIKEVLPEVERINLYGSPGDVLRKSEEDLKLLASCGLQYIYIGAESGNDEVLKDIKKGYTRDQIIEAVQKIERCGIKASVTFIEGLGGREKSRQHAIDTGTMISKMGASYVGVLTLLVDPSAPLYKDIQEGKFELLTADEVVEESILMMENIDENMKPCVFRANHATNYVSLRGNLPQDKERFLAELKTAQANKFYRDERFRAH
ncbi:MAG: radical SAM protein [Eubacteriales bacterium]|nr:radical SAM protein [Eubacteriales bacterium]MDY3332674.1 radical SAM protein [Gallibacter sp.]